MYKYRLPATSANLGIGFDCLGLALNIYNTYEVEESTDFELIGFMDRKLKDNLFYKAYVKTCKYFKTAIKPLKVNLEANVPIARGLGSSSAIIVGAIYAYYLVNEKTIDKAEILKLATSIEGHPDNVAPCIYGGLCCVKNGVLSNFKVSPKWKLYCLIPTYEVSTEEARKVIKHDIELEDAVNNIGAALIGIDGLINYDEKKVAMLNCDHLHEPYRKQLIKDYEKCRKQAFKSGASAFLISGSGSTMLVIAKEEIDLNFKDIQTIPVKVDYKGVICLKNS